MARGGTLGTLRTDRAGAGSVNGVVPLTSGDYSFAVKGVDSNGDVVLEPALE